MESKCPACKDYSTDFLNKIIQKDGVSDIIDFKFVPWGNARVLKDGHEINTTVALSELLDQTYGENGPKSLPGVEFKCQHGGPECRGNAYESCVQHLYPSLEQFFPVIDCIEARSCAVGEENGKTCDGPPETVATVCINKRNAHMDLQRVSDCAYGPLGSQLLIANALETVSLRPRKEYVPWVTVNGEHLGEADPMDSFLLGRRLCEAWSEQGVTAPAACSTFPRTVDEVLKEANQTDAH